MSELGSLLDVHKRLGQSPTVGLRRREGRLWVTSSKLNGMVLRSSMASTGADLEGTVDTAALTAFARGSSAVTLDVRDGRLFVTGKGIKGDLPVLTEEQARLPRIEETNRMAAPDVEWLRAALSEVTVSDLDKNGILCAACDGKSWSVSCADDSHGICAYGPGRSRLAFALVPGDAEVIRSLLDVPDGTQVSIGETNGLLVVRAGVHSAAVPVVDGRPQSLADVQGGVKTVGRVDSGQLRAALATVAPVATAKDAEPITLRLAPDRVTVSATSPTGSVQRALSARCTRELQVRVNYAMLAAVTARATDLADLQVKMSEEREPIRLTVRCGDTYMMMLTSP